MKNKHNPQVRKVIFLAGMLSAWSMAAVFSMMNFNPQAGILGVALNIIILVMTLTNLFPQADWVSFGFSILVYALVNIFRFGFTDKFLIISGVGFLVFFLSTFLSRIFKKQADALDEQFYYQNYVIDSLSVHDRITNLMNWRFAKRALITEIMRSRRYHGELCLVLFEVQQKTQAGIKTIEKIEKLLADIIQDVIRPDVDIPFISHRIGLILPERNLTFTKDFTERIIKILKNNIDVNISAGIANFPHDADNAQDLHERAEAALQVGLSSDQSLVLYQSLVKDKTIQKRDQSLTLANEGTEPVTVHLKKLPYNIYAKILKSIPLNELEWVVWIKGFRDLKGLMRSENNLLAIEHIIKAEFLFVQGNNLVLKIKSRLLNLAETDKPFPGWVLVKMNRKEHFLLIRQA